MAMETINNTKKLVQIIYEVNTGIGRIAENIGLVAQKNGYESYITYSRAFKPSKSITIKIGSKIEILFHVLLTRLFDLHGLGSYFSTKRLLNKIENINPDVIILHNIHGYYLNYKLLFKYLQKQKVPVFWVLHDCWAFTGHCAYFEYAGCNKWQKACGSCPLKNEYPKSFYLDNSRFQFFLKKRLYNNLSNLTLVPVSQWLADLTSKSILCHFPIKVIHNGVDVSIFNPDKLVNLNKKFGLNKDYYVLGVAAVWDYRKGLQYFKELSQRLRSEYQIVLVGLNNDQIKSLPHNIIGLSCTNNAEELAGLYAGSNVFVNPTLEDNFPSTNIESLACGTPVVTFDTGGSPEAIDGETGIIVEKGNVEKMVAAIQAICEDGKTKYLEKCRNRAVHHYDMNNCFQKYIDLFNNE